MLDSDTEFISHLRLEYKETGANKDGDNKNNAVDKKQRCY